MDAQSEGPPLYIHIEQNEYLYRKHKKLKEEDIAVCICKYEPKEPDSACGESCLNALTSTECTPGYCPCGVHCKNQKFQKHESPRLKLFNTEGRGWGLLAGEEIKAGQFIIEYCGEVISWKEAKRRAQAYEAQGLKDAFIISLNAHESIDATGKGSLARFINHSCLPNCETRKWTVLGEIRVGIFAKQDISPGTELAYDYNFEWYGGAKVRCLCGASSCFGFLGAKSRGFQEATYLWEDDDIRYSVDDIPLYDSEEDYPSVKLPESSDIPGNVSSQEENHLQLMIVDRVTYPNEEPISIDPLQADFDDSMVQDVKVEPVGPMEENQVNGQQNFAPKNAMLSRIRSNSACRNYYIKSQPLSKKRKVVMHSGGRLKSFGQMRLDAQIVGELLESDEARKEVLACEEMKKKATSQLDSLYDEIRPAIEEHEKDSQDSVSTSLAEKWIEGSCCKLKAEFDFYSIIMKHIVSAPKVRQKPAILDAVNHDEVCAGVYKGVTTSQLDVLAAETAASMTTMLVLRLGLLFQTFIRTPRNHSQRRKRIKEMHFHYNERSWKKAPLVADDVYDIIMKNAVRLDSEIIYDRDFDYGYFGFKTLERSYLLKVSGKVVERPQHMLMRVAVGIHKDDTDSVIQTYRQMSQRWFTHAPPTLFNAGTPRPQLSSRFLICMKEDSTEGIYDTLNECAVISKSAGGLVFPSTIYVQLVVTLVAQMEHQMELSQCFGFSMILLVMLTKEEARGRVLFLCTWNHGILIFLNFWISGNTMERQLNCFIIWSKEFLDFGLHLFKQSFQYFKKKQGYRARDLFYALCVPDLS